MLKLQPLGSRKSGIATCRWRFGVASSPQSQREKPHQSAACRVLSFRGWWMPPRNWKMKTSSCRGTFWMARLTGWMWQSHITCCSQQRVQRHAHRHQLNAACDHLGWAQGSGLYKRAVFWQIIISFNLWEHETKENRCKQYTSTLMLIFKCVCMHLKYSISMNGPCHDIFF